MFLYNHISIVLWSLLLYFSAIQMEFPIKRPKSYVCKYGFPKNSSIKCDLNKAMKCENRCDFSHNCDDKSDEINCGECDFTKDICGWKGVQKQSLSWVRVDYNNKTLCSDNQNKSCVLSLMRMKSNMTKNIARIRSPKFQTTSEFCQFEFAYKHLEKDCLLSISLVNENRSLWSGERLNLINENDKSDKSWKLESVDIGNIQITGYQMEFSITCDEKILNRKPNKSFLDIAIKNTSWIHCDKNTNKSIHFNGFQCDFRKNLCNKWADFQLTSDKFLHWKRSNNYLMFGENFENHLNQYFIFTENNINTSEIARLSSFKQNSIKSINFEYLLKNKIHSKLYLLIKEIDSNRKEIKKEIWTSNQSMEMKWQNICINIVNNETEYQIIFEAHFKATKYGIIAIKNITQSDSNFCPKDGLSEDDQKEHLITSTTKPSISIPVTNQVSITPYIIDTDVVPSLTTITNSSLLDKSFQINQFNDKKDNAIISDDITIETYAWILKGTALLIIISIFLAIKLWQRRRRHEEEFVPLTESYEMINNRSISSLDDVVI